MMFFSTDLLDEFESLWFQAPLVMSCRIQDMTAATLGGGSSGGAVEANRMVTEKLSAAVESAMAVNLAMVTEGVNAVTALASGTCPGLGSASDRVAVAALQPYGKRVRANVRRLSR